MTSHAKKVSRLLQALQLHKQLQVHSTTSCKPLFYGQHWLSEADSKWHGHVKGLNHKIVFPSQAYKDADSWTKLMARCGWQSTKIDDPNVKK